MRATRPSGRVASSVGNSLAAAIFVCLGEVTWPRFRGFVLHEAGRVGRGGEARARAHLLAYGQPLGNLNQPISVK